MEYIEIEFLGGEKIKGEIVMKDEDDDSVVLCKSEDGRVFKVVRWVED